MPHRRVLKIARKCPSEIFEKRANFLNSFSDMAARAGIEPIKTLHINDLA